MNYYNDNDKFCCKWLQKLMDNNLIPKGIIDDRNIKDIKPNDLKGFRQHHFFTGIGGWPYALRLANWPEDRQVWTGSCPCQPFSGAGKGGGFEDDRHLWPAFRWLIAKCKPTTVFGEQVASKLGREWLSGVRFDLEVLGYEVGAADLCAAGINAPHIRQRLFWVGDSTNERFQEWTSKEIYRKETRNFIKRSSNDSGVGNTESNDKSRNSVSRKDRKGVEARRSSDACGMANLYNKRPQRLYGEELSKCESEFSPWENSTLCFCKDEKYRRIPSKPSLFPLAHGIPNRVGMLRGAGNSIVPQLAAVFIKSFMEIKI